jgi:hypothetical protein
MDILKRGDIRWIGNQHLECASNQLQRFIGGEIVVDSPSNSKQAAPRFTIISITADRGAGNISIETTTPNQSGDLGTDNAGTGAKSIIIKQGFYMNLSAPDLVVLSDNKAILMLTKPQPTSSIPSPS